MLVSFLPIPYQQIMYFVSRPFLQSVFLSLTLSFQVPYNSNFNSHLFFFYSQIRLCVKMPHKN